MLLEREAGVNEPKGADVTPFAMAASSWSENMTEDQVEVSKHLLQHRANVSEQVRSTGYTALQTAITHGLADLVELLGEYDADPMVEDNSGPNYIWTCTLVDGERQDDGEAHIRTMQRLFDAIESDIP